MNIILGMTEIAQDTLLRMGKDQGLRAKLLHLDWPGLLQLNKAYPAIARLRSGRHVVVVGAIGSILSDRTDNCLL